MRLPLHRVMCLLGLLAISVAGGEAVDAQVHPERPVRIIIPQGAGTGPDVTVRIVADHLGRLWGQQALVVNQPGAGGAIAARAAASAAPDGLTLLGAPATFFVLPELQKSIPVDMADFVPIGFIGEVPMGIAVSPTLPVNSLPELVALSRSRPGGLNVAVGFRGGMPHLTAELIRHRFGADLTAVHYQSSAHAMNDIISGRVPILVEGVAGAVASSQLKLLAIASRTRSASHPDIPTVSESLPGFAATGWSVLVAPPRTPTAIANKLGDDLRTVLMQPDLNQQFGRLGTLTRSMSPQELADFIRSERQLWGAMVKQIGPSKN
jgi:tripartite-type tricarboxylate transporter receptor subunit TctC